MRPIPLSCRTCACLVLACCLSGSASGAATPSDQDCMVAAEQGGTLFPVDKLDAPSRCRIGGVVHGYTTAGLIGPVQSPVTPELYEYLLDRPPLIASLTDRLGLGAYQFTARGLNQYWVNDGEGTQGLMTLVFQDSTHRIYHIDGFHEGQIFPMVRAKAAVFMHITPVTTADGYSVVETSLMAYTKLDDSILAGLVRVLRPLIGDAVTRKLSRGFDVTNQLGAAIAQDRDRVAQQASLVPWLSTAELQTLIGWLYTIPQRTVPAPAALPPPPTPASP
ncbi:MAG TPA: hypothetical protein VGA17_07340 [Nitrospiraceae bacterium]